MLLRRPPWLRSPGATLARVAFALLLAVPAARSQAAPSPAVASGADPSAAADPWRVAPVPAWVAPLPVPPPPSVAPDGPRDLLLDEQTDLRGSTHERFVRWASWLVDEIAVQEQSQVEIDFDPSAEQLLVHTVAVHRDGRVLDRLRPERVQLLHRELEAEALLYDGTRTWLLLLDDVRRGDVLEVAYTLRGGNPVFGEHRLASLWLGSEWPVERVHQRVLVPDGAPLYTRTHGAGVPAPLVVWHPPGGAPPVTGDSLEQGAPGPAGEPSGADDWRAAWLDWTWTRSSAPGVPFAPGAPSWSSPWPWVQLSDFADWGEVVDWGRALYDPLARAAAEDAEVRARVDELRAAAADDSARVAAALRFVQDEVRYLGLELGPGSHRPRPPAETLARRYGDCKDKSLLLVALLEGLGLDAAPALVSTTWRERLDDWHASPWAFDHVIVRARVDGLSLWLDPTVQFARGDVRARTTADFGRALVLAPGESALAVVPAPTADDVLVHVVDSLRREGGGWLLERVVQHHGLLADEARRALAWDGLELLGQDQDAVVGSAWPGARRARALSVSDDEVANVLSLSGSWRLAAPPGHLAPAGLADWLPFAAGPARRQALAVAHPTRVVHELLMPDAAFDPALAGRVEGPAFSLTRDVSAEGRLRFQLDTHADHVPSARLAAHDRALEQAGALMHVPRAGALGPAARTPRGPDAGPAVESRAARTGRPGAPSGVLGDVPGGGPEDGWSPRALAGVGVAVLGAFLVGLLLGLRLARRA